VKRSRRAQTVLGDRHDLVYEILLQVTSAACGTRPAEFFNGWARKLERDAYSDGYSHGNALVRAAVKRSRRAQTVLGDRHDLVCEILLQVLSAACGTRPAEFFKLGTHIDLRVRRRDHVLREFASRVGVRVGEAQHV